MERVGGDKKRYDTEMRPDLMVRALSELQGAGVEPDVWKIEGLDDRAHCEAVAHQARSGAARAHVGCIVLGRGENEAKVLDWLRAAAPVEGFIGFAVGRTTFWSSLIGVKDGTLTREQATQAIADNYRKWVELFLSGG